MSIREWVWDKMLVVSDWVRGTVQRWTVTDWCALVVSIILIVLMFYSCCNAIPPK